MDSSAQNKQIVIANANARESKNVNSNEIEKSYDEPKNCELNDGQQPKHDHRALGRELELFSFHQEGPGFPFFHENGIALKNALIDYWRSEHQAEGYKEIQSPILLDKKLWEKSGHWQLYKDKMYVSEIEKHEFAIKPMNCPGAILHYQEKRRSHAELPLRIAELGQVHRDELSGALHGLLRVRSFVVDDAHLFCKRDQLLGEVKKILRLAVKMLKRCGFEQFEIELSVRSSEPVSSANEKYLGDDLDWSLAESVLEQALKECELQYRRMPGEAKFYGPAIDLKIKDGFDRSWQCSSIQMDFNLGRRFDLKYFDEAGKKQVPFILHRCIYGSLERLIAVLLEHHQGRLPFWLAPAQIHVISAPGVESLQLSQDLPELQKVLYQNRWRHSVDDSNASLGKKIKRAQSLKVPAVLIVGKNELAKGVYSLRLSNRAQFSDLSLDELVEKIESLE